MVKRLLWCAAALLVLCVGVHFFLHTSYAAPVLTAAYTGTITAQHPESWTISTGKSTRVVLLSDDIAPTASVGDSVAITTEISANNTEKLLSAQVLAPADEAARTAQEVEGYEGF